MLWWGLQNTITTAVLAVAILLLCRVKNLSPAVRHGLWCVALVKLLLPPLVTWPWPVTDIGSTIVPKEMLAGTYLDSPKATPTLLTNAPEFGSDAYYQPSEWETSEQYAPAQLVERSYVPESDPNYSKWDVVVFEEVLVVPQVDERNATSPIAVPVVVKESPGRWPFDLAQSLAIFWLAGSVIVLWLQALRIVRMQRVCQSSSPAPGWLTLQVGEWSARLNIRPPRIETVAGISTPMIWAFGPVRLLWPQNLSQQDATHGWQGVIIHELAHIRRRDHWIGWLELIAAAIWWWNPVFWCIRNHLRENAELACDAWVVQSLPDGRRAYAEAILSVCDFATQTTAPLPATGIGPVARRNLERRLTMIICERVPFRISRSGALTILLLCLLSLPAWTQDTATEADVDQPPLLTESDPDAIDQEPVDIPIAPIAAAELLPSEPATTSAAGLDEPDTRQADPLDATPLLADEPDPEEPPRRRKPRVTSTRPAPADFEQPMAVTPGQPRPVRPVESSRIQQLETMVKQLQSQLESLQSPNRPRAAPTDPPIKPLASDFAIPTHKPALTVKLPELPDAVQIAGEPERPMVTIPNISSAAVMLGGQRSASVKPNYVVDSSTFTMTRTGYRLTAEKAQALAQFLYQNLDVDVSVKIQPDTPRTDSKGNEEKRAILVVTTTADAQKVVRDLVGLMQSAKTRRSAMNPNVDVFGISDNNTNTFDSAEETWAQPADDSPFANVDDPFGSRGGSRSRQANSKNRDDNPFADNDPFGGTRKTPRTSR